MGRRSWRRENLNTMCSEGDGKMGALEETRSLRPKPQEQHNVLFDKCLRKLLRKNAADQRSKVWWFQAYHLQK